jgi:hypothetical protein
MNTKVTKQVIKISPKIRKKESKPQAFIDLPSSETEN